MIKLNKVCFEYNEDNKILNNVDFEIEKEKITVVLGKNGVGKTTLLSLIDGYLTHDSGKIIKQKESAYIYDTPYLYEYLTGEEYLSLMKEISQDRTKLNIEELIKDLEMEEAIGKTISSYSLGMKHKLALLSSILLNYKLYLIDEPLASLDPESQKFMIEFFKKMKIEGKTLVISTHMLFVAYTLADDFVIFKNKELHKFENSFSSYEDFEDFVIKNIKADI